MIKIDNVSKQFGEFVAVNNVSLTINDGEIFGFLGPNGAGKSTTLKMITGITEMSSGEILIDEHSIKKDPVGAKKQFGFVPDSPDNLLKLRGIEYLNFIGSIYQVPKDILPNKISELAKDFEMDDALNDRIGNYSHGMRQKIAVIGVLLHDPQNFILDEPMTGLDPKSARVLKDRMRAEADKGHSVLFSTHVLEVAERICDRIAIINKGEIIYVGTIDEIHKLHENESLEELFLNLTGGEE